MNRLGLNVEEIEDIIKLAKNKINVSLIMSHLSCSENKTSKMNNLQLSKFKTVKKKLQNIKRIKI